MIEQIQPQWPLIVIGTAAAGSCVFAAWLSWVLSGSEHQLADELGDAGYPTTRDWPAAAGQFPTCGQLLDGEEVTHAPDELEHRRPGGPVADTTAAATPGRHRRGGVS